MHRRTDIALACLYGDEPIGLTKTAHSFSVSRIAGVSLSNFALWLLPSCAQLTYLLEARARWRIPPALGMFKGLMMAMGAMLRNQSSRPRVRTIAMSVRKVDPLPVSRFFNALTLQPEREAKVVRSMFSFNRSDLICCPMSTSISSMVFAVTFKDSNRAIKLNICALWTYLQPLR